MMNRDDLKSRLHTIIDTVDDEMLLLTIYQTIISLIKKAIEIKF